VETKYFHERDALKHISSFDADAKASITKRMPQFDAKKLLAEDELNKGFDIPLRFGNGFDVHITLDDGKWQDTKTGRVWSTSFESKGAYSINFVFNNLFMAEGAELYIANSEGTVLYGPVTSKQNRNKGRFLTDFIAGDNVTVYLFEPYDKKGGSTLTIQRVVHAYATLNDSGFSALLDCHNDVSCYPEWNTESDAVAMIILNDAIRLCTGSLLITANKSFKPYILSAFHCIDALRDGTLSNDEISAAEDWAFKFKYKNSLLTD